VWQFGVLFERSFIYPVRVKVKEPRVSEAAKTVNFHAPRFLAGRDNHLSHRPPESVFASLAGVEATKDK
jgi:hypothetical protein